MSIFIDGGIREAFSDDVKVFYVGNTRYETLVDILRSGDSTPMYGQHYMELYSRDRLSVIDSLQDILPMLDDPNGRYLVHLLFEQRPAKLFEHKWYGMSKYLYGSITLHWVFSIFNNIPYPSDMTAQYLTTSGLYVPSRRGLELMTKANRANERALRMARNSGILFEEIYE